MIKSLLAATTALALMTGGAFAQAPQAPGYQQTSPYAPPNAVVPMADTIDSTIHLTTKDGAGSSTSKSTSKDTTISPDGDKTTRKSSDTTTIR